MKKFLSVLTMAAMSMQLLLAVAPPVAYAADDSAVTRYEYIDTDFENWDAVKDNFTNSSNGTIETDEDGNKYLKIDATGSNGMAAISLPAPSGAADLLKSGNAYKLVISGNFTAGDTGLTANGDTVAVSNANGTTHKRRMFALRYRSSEKDYTPVYAYTAASSFSSSNKYYAKEERVNAIYVLDFDGEAETNTLYIDHGTTKNVSATTTGVASYIKQQSATDLSLNAAKLTSGGFDNMHIYLVDGTPEFEVKSVTLDDTGAVITFSEEVTTEIDAYITANDASVVVEHMADSRKVHVAFASSGENVTIKVAAGASGILGGALAQDYTYTIENVNIRVEYVWADESFDKWDETNTQWRNGSTATICETVTDEEDTYLHFLGASATDRILKYTPADTYISGDAAAQSILDSGTYTMLIKLRAMSQSFSSGQAAIEFSTTTGKTTTAHQLLKLMAYEDCLGVKVQETDTDDAPARGEWVSMLAVIRVADKSARAEYYVNGRKIEGDFDAFDMTDVNGFQIASRGKIRGYVDDIGVYFYQGADNSFTAEIDAEDMAEDDSIAVQFSNEVGDGIYSAVTVNGQAVPQNRIKIGKTQKSARILPPEGGWTVGQEHTISISREATDVFGTELSEVSSARFTPTAIPESEKAICVWEDSQDSGRAYTARIYALSTLDEATDAQIFFGEYTPDGILAGVEVKTWRIPNKIGVTVLDEAVRITKQSESNSVRVFIWNKDTLAPLPRKASGIVYPIADSYVQSGENEKKTLAVMPDYL